ncbi:hypothetical protein HUW46_03517 [Amycolatopsis sp. CA-230715]|nr:hypothetical protein HUW46_03517 [Amycolatopsis sp. CA-230715]
MSPMATFGDPGATFSTLARVRASAAGAPKVAFGALNAAHPPLARSTTATRLPRLPVPRKFRALDSPKVTFGARDG